MHIVAINQFYAPDRSATSQLLTELAEGLVARGHRVTVLAASDVPIRNVNGVHVVGIPATRFGKSTLLRRAADYGSFYLGVLRALARLEVPPDVFLPLTTPPLVALAPELAAWRRRTPVVALVQDLYPDVAVALGVVPLGGLVDRAWGRATALSLRGAARVVALSEAMAGHILAYGVSADRIDVIPNWALAELDATPSKAQIQQIRLEYGLGDRFAVMYSGNLGAGHSFDTLCAAMRRLAHRPDIAFVFVGDGVRRAEVEAFVARERLAHVRFQPLAPRERLAESLAAADLHLITMRDGLEGLIVPSKLYGVLAARRPALFIGPTEDGAAQTLRAAGAGVAFDNGDVDGVVAAITKLADDREAASRMGERGRHHLERELGRERALDAYERTLACAGGRNGARQNKSEAALGATSMGGGRR
jgi:glycosyltransferase involved in cell wall biosynthesis